MLLQNILHILEEWAPAALQESYDNSGLLVGNTERDIAKALICLDVTEAVLQEAIDNQCNLIISHHPVIFGSLKRLNGTNMTERIVISAIKNDIALYAIHTNLDNTFSGVNQKICECIGIKDPKILEVKRGMLRKLVTFCPDILLPDGRHAPEAVREALWNAGAGHIGKYDQCSFNADGSGTFRALEGADPYIGSHGELTKQPEVRIEVIYPVYNEKEILKQLRATHPYEEVAYDKYVLENGIQTIGAGMIGDLEHAMDEMEFILHLKGAMQTNCVRYSPLINRKVKKISVCGGSGSFLLKQAIAQGADVLVTADFKYHQFFEAEGKIVIADIGHYESEQFTIGLIFDKIMEKMPNFALLKTRVNTNPVNYI
jgi:dinuclear metal center YbgI/SA1388 family protein